MHTALSFTATAAGQLGMVIVSRAAFLAYVLPQDLVLRAERDFIEWETRGRRLVGRSFPDGTFALTREDADDAARA